MKDRINFISPFTNDPFAMVYQAFQNLYPGKKCSIIWETELLENDSGEGCVGLTHFGENGEIIVAIYVRIPVADAVITLGHELAHVAVGSEADHGEEWEKAFEAIGEEYNRIGDEIFGEESRASVLVSDGKGGYDPDLAEDTIPRFDDSIGRMQEL